MKSIVNQLYLVIFLGFFILNSCSTSKSNVTPEQRTRLSELVHSKNFEIISDVAYPQVSNAMLSLQNSVLIAPGNSINQMSLIGNVNYLKIVNDSIYTELPYFGERRMSTGYNGSDSSISIKGLLQNYKLEKKDDDESYLLSFEARTTHSELLEFNITIFPNFKTYIFLNGVTRTSIRYSGEVHLLKQ